MKILEIKKIEDCISDKNVWDLYFDKIIGEYFLQVLSELGKVVMHQYKPKPFFKLIVRGKYTLKGSVGNRSARLILPDFAMEDDFNTVISILNNRLNNI